MIFSRLIPLLLLFLCLEAGVSCLPLSDDEAADNASTWRGAAEVFRKQGTNPRGIGAVLLLAGGDVVQKAVAQLTGGENTRFTPVVFSFGWVSYAFQSLSSALGDGDFMPKPEQSSWVVDLWSGDRRQNQSWVLGRLIRDLEVKVNEQLGKMETRGPWSLLVTVYKIPSGGRDPKNPKKDLMWSIYFFVVAVQLVIAAIPMMIGDWHDWSILLVVGVGNILSLLTASLPTMRTQKYQLESKTGSESYYALTRGNGNQHVFIILPNDVGKNGQSQETVSRLPHLDHMATARHRAGLSARLLSAGLAGLWAGLLIFVGGLDSHSWFLVGAGLLGLLHNIGVSAFPRDSYAHGIPLEPLEPESDHKFGRDPKHNVQQILRHLERRFPRAGHALKPIFIPGHEPRYDTTRWREPDVSLESCEERFRERWAEIYPTWTFVSWDHHPRHPSPGREGLDEGRDLGTVGRTRIQDQNASRQVVEKSLDEKSEQLSTPIDNGESSKSAQTAQTRNP